MRDRGKNHGLLAKSAPSAGVNLHSPSSRARLLGGATLAALVIGLLAAALAASTASAAPPRFVGLQGWDPEPSLAKLRRMELAKVDVWRVNVTWRTIEPQPGQYKWDHVDRLFAHAASRNVRIFPVLIGSPPWANWKPQYPPKNAETRRAFFRFAQKATDRYGPTGYFWRGKPWSRYVRAWYWQVWNEPNLPNYWNGRVDPADYGRFLKSTSIAAKNGDPEARIVSAGLPQTTCSAGPCIDDFLREMYTVPGVGNAIDAVAVHTYSDDYRGIFYRLGLARDQTRRSLGTSKRMFVTEFGWATGGNHRYFSTSPSGQASRLRDAYRKMIEHRRSYRLMGAFWFALKDDPERGSSWQYNTGLFDRYWHQKPAWKALAEITGGQP